MARRSALLFAAVALVGLVTACGATVVRGIPSAARATGPSPVRVEVHVPSAASFDAIGAGPAAHFVAAARGPALLTASGLPRVLFVGAEYCPYCAPTSWSLAVALLRFGTLGPLGAIRSSPEDVDPNTAGLTFRATTFHGTRLGFTGVELFGAREVAGRYPPLDHLAPADRRVVARLDPSTGLPFVDLGGRYLISGSTFAPAVLHGRSQAQIVAALDDPSSAIAKAVDGTANVITAALCVLTSGAPASVCRSPGVTSAAAILPR